MRSREIKFRGMYAGDDEEPKGFVYGSLVFLGEKDTLIECWEKGDHNCWLVDRETVGQLEVTIHDHSSENLLKIYTGDILKIYTEEVEKGFYITEVKPKGVVESIEFYDRMLIEWLEDFDDIVVIGNIYENPELML